MTISERLKEERVRLKMSQTAFAAIAGATKSAQIKWEGGATSAPTAPALAAWAEAGVDVLYVLTGRKTQAREETVAVRIGDQVDEIERDLLEPLRHGLRHKDEDQQEAETIQTAVGRLKALLKYDTALMPPELAERASRLLEIASDPTKLSLFRAADFAQNRRKRERIKADIAEYLEGIPYRPSGEVMSQLSVIAFEYAVPAKLLAYVVWDIVFEVTGRPKYSSGDDEIVKTDV